MCTSHLTTTRSRSRHCHLQVQCFSSIQQHQHHRSAVVLTVDEQQLSSLDEPRTPSGFSSQPSSQQQVEPGAGGFPQADGRQQLQQLHDPRLHLRYADEAPSSSSGSSSRSSSSSMGLYDGDVSRRKQQQSALGSAYVPGELWHIRRRSATAQAGSAASGLPTLLQQQQQQQQGQKTGSLSDLESMVDESEVDFVLLDRLGSNAAASSSGRDSSSSGSSAQIEQMRPAGSPYGSSSSSGYAPASDQQLLLDGVELLGLSQRSAAANFRDERFEQAIGRWMKEAPDWFKIRSVSARGGCGPGGRAGSLGPEEGAGEGGRGC